MQEGEKCKKEWEKQVSLGYKTLLHMASSLFIDLATQAKKRYGITMQLHSLQKQVHLISQPLSSYPPTKGWKELAISLGLDAARLD